MTVDQLKAALADIMDQTAADAEDVVSRHDFRGDSQCPGFLGERTVPETDQLGGNGLVEVLQQAQDVGFGTAGVAAADQMNDLHEKAFLPALKAYSMPLFQGRFLNCLLYTSWCWCACPCLFRGPCQWR